MNQAESTNRDATVVLLSEGETFTRLDQLEIELPCGAAASLSVEQRVILSDDLVWTYLVESLIPSSSSHVKARLRRGRPVLDPCFVSSLFTEAGRGACPSGDTGIDHP